MRRFFIALSCFGLFFCSISADQSEILTDTIQDSSQILKQIIKQKSSRYKRVQKIEYEVSSGDQQCFIGKVSKDGQFAVTVIVDKENQWLRWNGIERDQYYRITGVYISETGNQVGYYAYKKEKYYAVVGGKEYGTYIEIDDTLVFSKDGSQFLYNARKQRTFSTQIIVNINGKEKSYKNFLSTETNYFSPDGKHSIYIVRDGKKCAPIFDGQKIGKYEMTGLGPYWSEDSKTLAYTVMRNDTAFIAINNELKGGYSKIIEFNFSPDGSEYAYIASDNYDYYLYKGNDPRIGPYDMIWSPTYSPDGSKFGYVIKEDSSIFLIVDSTKLGTYKDLSFPIFNNDGSQLAYMVWLTEDTTVPNQAVVIDGKLGPTYKYVYLNTISFSPDGKRSSYLCESDTLEVMAVIDGVPGKKYQWIDGVTFSPDGEDYYYRAQIHDSAYCVVKNGVEGKHYRAVYPLALSKDGANLAYFVVVDGNYKLRVNNSLHGAYREIKPKTPVFDDDNVLHFFGSIMRDKVVKVTLTPVD